MSSRDKVWPILPAFVALLAAFAVLLPANDQGRLVRGAQAFSQEGMQPGAPLNSAADKIDPEMWRAAQVAGVIRVMIVLTEQPQRNIVARHEELARARVEAALNRYREMLARAGQTSTAEVGTAWAELEEIQRQTRQAAAAEIASELAPSQKALDAVLAQVGAKVLRRYQAINVVAAEAPAWALGAIASHPLVAKMHLPSTLMPQLRFSVPELGAPSFWNSGFTGVGQTVGLLDTGVRTDHPAFFGLNIVSRIFLDLGSQDECFDDTLTSGRDLQGHGTHTAGIIASRGSSDCVDCRGVAKALGTLYNLKVGYKLKPVSPCVADPFGPPKASADTGDILAAIDWLVQNTAVRTLNLSLGGTTLQDDDPFAQSLDQLVDIYGLLLAVSAGNGGPEAMTVNTPGLAYNILSVANWSARGTIHYSSSRGPTPGGRRKPDIAAPGTNILSLAYNWDEAGRDDFVIKTGTSMAAPHIAGAGALLMQAGVIDMLAIKSILLNSTDNVGWENDRGWGYANLNTARNSLHYKTGQLAARPAPGHYHFYSLRNPGYFKATATWNRHIARGSTSAFNNIDLYAYSRTSGSPLSASELVKDNVEQVSGNAPEDVIVKVKMMSTSLAGGIAREKYAIAFSTGDITSMTGPVLAVNCTPSSNPVEPSAAFTVRCTASNWGDLPAFGALGALTLPPGFSGSSATAIGVLQPSASGSGVFELVASGTPGNYTFQASVQGTAYDESFMGTTSFELTVAAPETVSAPRTPAGTVSGSALVSYSYSSGEARSSLDHSVQYLFDWGDGTSSGWLAVGVTGASHSWSSAGSYTVRAKARCAVHTAIESGWSGSLTVRITAGQSKIAAFSEPAWLVDANGNFAWDGPGADGFFYWSLGSGSVPVRGDWNGTGKQKIGVYKDGTWLLDYNGNGLWDGAGVDKIIYFGGPGFTPVVGDWNGSGWDKLGAYRDGTWVLDYNGNFQWDGTGVDKLLYFGGPGFTPVTGDWNGTGWSKLGAHQNGLWILDYNGNFQWDGVGVDKLVFFGGEGYTPVLGDWNGTGSTKIGAYRDGTWILDYNGNLQWDGPASDKLIFYGGAGCAPVVGDWNGTGGSKIGAYCRGTWIIDYNGNFLWDGPGVDRIAFYGGEAYTPVPGKW